MKFWNDLKNWLNGLFNKAATVIKSPIVPISATPWMDWIAKHEGEHEVSGSKDNAFIMSLYKYANYPTEHDEVPWCAALVNAALKLNGYKGSNSAAAKSFDNYGTPCELKFGAIVTIRHHSGGRHVTFFYGWENEAQHKAICFGGNQSNALRKTVYDLSGNRYGNDEVVASRWPVK